MPLLCLGFASASTAQDGSPNGSLDGFEARFIDVDGVPTRYYDVGTGDPMLLVHGSGFSGTASANTWTLNLAGLSERYRVLAPDKLASGMTGNPESDEALTIRGEVEHMYEFVRTLGLGPVHLIGQSRGAGLALLFAVQHPEMVRTLVLVSSSTASPPAGDDRSNRRARLFENCPDDENPAGDRFRCQQSALYYRADAVTDDFVTAAGHMWAQPKARETDRRVTAQVRQLNNSVTSEMVHQAYHRILSEQVLQMPVLIYWGKNDPSVLPQQGYALYDIVAESNPRAWLLFTNRGGHFHYREHPEEFNRNVLNFIDAW
jgi:2-hydroxy-6-oxonona-2,4-dienedioate hydrolase